MEPAKEKIKYRPYRPCRFGKKQRKRPEICYANIEGETLTFRQINKRYGISLNTLYNRYARGFRDADLLNAAQNETPMVKGRPLYEWSRELNISYQTLYKRLIRGWTEDEILRKD